MRCGVLVAMNTSVVVFRVMTPCNHIGQHGTNGGPWVTSGPGQLVTRLVKLFVNLLLATKS
jgi:hypothetical protein